MIHQRKEYLAKSFVLLVMLVSLLYLLCSGQLAFYVHPRIRIFIVLSCFVLAFLLLANMRMLAYLRHTYHDSYCRIVVLPFVIMLGLSFFNRSTAVDPSKEKKMEIAKTGIARPLSQRIHDAKFTLLDSEFYDFNRMLYDKMDVLNGKQITYTVFVHYDDKMKSNEFMAARKTMVCCAADMIPLGLLVDMQTTPTWKEGTWIQLTGIIHYKKDQGSPVPYAYLTYKSAHKVEKPSYDVVYPDF